MLNQYYNAEINILLCRCRMVSVSHDWRKSIFLPVDFWRLYYHHDSYVDILFENTPARIPSGQLILIPPNTKLSHEMKHDFKQFYIHFLAAAPYDHCRAGIYPIETDAAMSRLLDGLMAEAEEKEVRAPSRIFSIRLEALCGLALSRFPENAVLQNHANKQIETVIHHIDRFYGEKLSNRKLSRVSGMAPNSFIRLFRLKTGAAPQHYLREKRIRQAAVLLRYTGKSIPEIAEECGFASRYHFSRVFKQIKGYSPAEFRRYDFSSTI